MATSSLPTTDELRLLGSGKLAHATLDEICPPDSFVVSSGPILVELLGVTEAGVHSPCRAIGLALGGTTPITDLRWTYLESKEQLDRVGKAVFLQVLRPAGEDDESLFRSGDFCVPYHQRSFLAPGTARWQVLRAVAQLFVRAPSEDYAAHLARCQRWAAWAVSDLRGKPAVVVALLWQMVRVLEEAPADVRLAPATDVDEVLIEAVERIRLSDPQLTARDVCSQLIAAGVACDLSEVRRALSKATKTRCRHAPSSSASNACPSDLSAASTNPAFAQANAAADNEQEGGSRTRGKQRARREEPDSRAKADAEEMFDAEVAVKMHEHGIKNPTAHEAARLRRLAERLVRQRSERDFNGCVETWNQIWLDEGAAPPSRQQLKEARARVAMFFHSKDPVIEALVAAVGGV